MNLNLDRARLRVMRSPRIEPPPLGKLSLPTAAEHVNP